MPAGSTSGRKVFVTPHSPAAPAVQHTPTVPFSSLKLAQPLLDAIASDGYTNPTPIQAQAIPPAVEGRDVLGIAQTGTGKTAAFALPILNHQPWARPRGEGRQLQRTDSGLMAFWKEVAHRNTTCTQH
jgi:superfamily II DNA/RNA helicase